MNVNFVYHTCHRMQKELSENESKDFIDSIKDSTDVTLAADDDKEILEDSVENVDAGDVKTEINKFDGSNISIHPHFIQIYDELQTPGQI